MIHEDKYYIFKGWHITVDGVTVDDSKKWILGMVLPNKQVITKLLYDSDKKTAQFFTA